MVKEERGSNAMTEEHYKTHCLATLSTPKKNNKSKAGN